MVTGEQIRRARKRLGISQSELAKRVDVALRTVGGWERGETSPGIAEQRLIEVLGLEEDDREEDPPLTWDDFDNLGPRLAGIDRQLDALWRRVDELQQQLDERGEAHDRAAATKEPERGRPTNPPDSGSIAQLGDRKRTYPAIQETAARPGVSKGRQQRKEQDEAVDRPDPEGPEFGA